MTDLMYSPQDCLAGLCLVAPSAPPALYYSLLLVCCRYRALLVCLFFYSVDIPDGENPEFLIKCKTLHMQGEILGGLASDRRCNVPAAGRRSDNSSAWRASMDRGDICGKTWNVCNFLNIILDWPALFRMCVQTMYTDEWPSKGIPPCCSVKWPVQAKLNTRFCQDNVGVWADLPCPGAGWWRRATQPWIGPLWGSEIFQAACRMSQTWSRKNEALQAK